MSAVLENNVHMRSSIILTQMKENVVLSVGLQTPTNIMNPHSGELFVQYLMKLF